MFYDNVSKNVFRYFNLVKNLSNWWLHLEIKLGLTAADPVLFRTRQGVLIEAPRSLLPEFREIFLSECYTRGMTLPATHDPVVLDIGANVGFFTLYILSRLPGARIIAYEPVAANFRQLERNLQMNSGYNVSYFQKAVAGHSGNLTLHYNLNEGYTTAASIYEKPKGNTEALTVTALSLRDVFEQNGLERCDLLKMDCEGAEFDILYNCPREIIDRIGCVVMEVHGAAGLNNIDSLQKYLEGMGFDTHGFPIHPGSASVGMLRARRRRSAMS
jgi:FkbM family methyltransferase